MSFNPFMDLHNAPLSGSLELLRKEALEKAVEHSSCVLHGEVIWKVVMIEKPLKKPAKHLQFSQSVCLTQSAKRSGPQSS